MSTTTKRAGKKESPKSRSKDGNSPSPTQLDRKALVKSLRGSLSWVAYSVDQYLQEKYDETERESRS